MVITAFECGYWIFLQYDQYGVECAYKALSTLSVVDIELRSFSCGNGVRRHTKQEELFASVKDDEVFSFCTVFTKKRSGAIRIDRVASARRGIRPISDFSVGASRRANGAACSIAIKDGYANPRDGATYDIIDARSAENISPFEIGNATAALVAVNDGPRYRMGSLSLIQHRHNDCDTE